ncbi:MAG: alpha/beta hydrolase [Granulosicoccaceae bacterium]
MPDNKHDRSPIADRTKNWDDAYANAAHIPKSDTYIEQWAGQSKQFREQQVAVGRSMANMQYGPHDRECIDVFQPEGEPTGIAIFVHGGYWLRFSQRDWSHLATGALASHHITTMIGYPLCPESTISEIASGISKALNVIAEQYPKLPIFLAGHSAGGHLATHLMCKPSALDQSTQKRIRRVLSISGVHDLVPLTKTIMNEQFGLSFADATALSPARLRPHLPCPVIAWAGGNERPEFIRQNRLLESAWAPLGADCQSHLEPDRHHFNVIDDLTKPNSPMMKRWLAP